MKKTAWACAALALTVAAGVAVSQPEKQPAKQPEKQPEKTPAKPAQPPATPPTAPKMDKKAVAAMMTQNGAPGEEHKALDPLIGEFDATFTFGLGPGMGEMTAKGTMKSEWILGKRFVQSTSTPTADEELKIESMSVFGYDKRHKKYTWWGIDSSDTYSVSAEGDYDAATKTFTLLGENEEPGVGKLPFKTVLAIPDNDHSTMQIWFQMKGAPGADAEGWFKVMEIAKARKK